MAERTAEPVCPFKFIGQPLWTPHTTLTSLWSQQTPPTLTWAERDCFKRGRYQQKFVYGGGDRKLRQNLLPHRFLHHRGYGG